MTPIERVALHWWFERMGGVNAFAMLTLPGCANQCGRPAMHSGAPNMIVRCRPCTQAWERYIDQPFAPFRIPA